MITTTMTMMTEDDGFEDKVSLNKQGDITSGRLPT
jgi:hypothetical protein